MTLDVTASEGGGTLSYNTQKQNGSPRLPSGEGGNVSYTAGKQQGGPQASDVAMLGDVRSLWPTLLLPHIV